MPKEMKLSRREREKLRQRRDILTAALDLFARNGYHNVSMNEIAERAEFAVGTLYKFFPSKQDIYENIMTESADKFHRSLTTALREGGDEIEKLRNYVRANSLIFKEDASIIRLYHAETRGVNFNVNAGVDEAIRKQFKKLQQEVAEVFRQGIQKKIFNDIADPYHLAVSLSSIIHGFLILWLEEPENHTCPGDPDAVLNILFNNLLKS